MKNVVLHVGLHKTASTLLQEKVFPFIDNLYCSETYIENKPKTPFNYLKPELSILNYSSSEFLDIKNELNDYINAINEHHILHSNEGLACSYFANKHNIINNAKALKAIFNNVKIIFVIRKQTDWLQSFYSQTAIKNNNYSVNDYGGYKDKIKINDFLLFKKNHSKNGDYININDLDWLFVAQGYIEAFGRENILVLPYELLKEDLNGFLDEFYEFTGFKPYYPENIEYIIIDGASTDNTNQIIKKYKDKLGYYISEPDKGMYEAMNKGLKAANGDWIFILNSDDSFMDNDVVKNAAKELINFVGDILLGDIFLDHKIDAHLHNRVKSYRHVNTMTMFHLGLYQQAMFYNKKVFEKYGGFDENYKLISDLDWFYKFYKKLKIKYVEQVFCKFLIGGRSNNEEFAKVSDKERNILEEKYLKKWHLKLYEALKSKEKSIHGFAHKYFRSIARNKFVAKNTPIFFWSTVSTLLGWKVKLIKN